MVWRLCSRRFKDDALTGEGARRKGNRWNEPGTPVVYCAENLSLAILESLVHFSIEDIPEDFVQIQIFIPDPSSIKTISRVDLATDWAADDNKYKLRKIGTDWAKRRESLVLIAPSVIVPSENNYLINPRHPEIKKVTVKTIDTFTFDPRLTEK